MGGLGELNPAFDCLFAIRDGVAILKEQRGVT